VPGVDFNAVRAEITMEQDLTLLRFGPVHRSGEQRCGACPLHGSASGRSRSLSVNVAIGCTAIAVAATVTSSTIGPPPAICRAMRLPSTCATGLVETCPGFVAGESPLRGHGGKATRLQAQQRRGHRYSRYWS
jgi:hypothetical protein